jgi:hypothetical protein
VSARTRALRAAAEAADPLLPDREKAAADLARFEEQMEAACWAAVREWLTIAAAAALGGTLTAGPEDVVPDASGIPAKSEEWGRLVEQHIVAGIEKLLGARFGELLDQDGVVSARPWQEKYLAEVRNRMEDIPASTFDAVRAAIQVGIDDGDGIPAIRDRIAGALSARLGGSENGWRKRSQTIARTETIGAYNGGQLAASRVREAATGVVLDKVWLATIDSRTRKDHYRADGQRVRLDEQFQIGTSELDHPGDPTAPPKQTVNCRCTMLEVEATEETPNTSRRQLRDADDVAGEIKGRADAEQTRAYDDPAEQEKQDTRRRAAVDAVARAARTTSPATTAEAGAEAAEARRARAAQRRAERKLEQETDEGGVPLRLSFDYLGNLGEDQLDDLAVHLLSRLDDGNPLEGQRWDDYEKFMDYKQREEGLVDDLLAGNAPDAQVTAAVEKFQREHGTPGLTHERVGGRAERTSPTRQDVQLEYASFLEEQYVTAEGATRGHMLNAAGRAAGIDPRSLFSGEATRAARYASEELLEFWEGTRRTGWSEFYYARTGSPGSARAAARQAEQNALMDRDRSVLRASADGEPEPSAVQVLAYDSGRAAQAAGEPSTACPYEPGTDEFRLWVRGFVLARYEAIAWTLFDDGAIDDEPPTYGGPNTVTASATPEGTPTMARRTWRSKPYLAPFAKPTGDGRIFRVGGLTSRDLPLPLLYQESTGMGHDGSTTVGRILTVEFTTEGIVSTGDYLDDPALAEPVGKAIALVEAGLGGVSVDLDSVTGSLVDEDGEPVDMEWLIGQWEQGENPTVLEQVDEGRLIGVTQVATPAFAEAAIELDPVEVEEQPTGGDTAAAALQDSEGVDLEVGLLVDVEAVTFTGRGAVTEVDEDAETVVVDPEDDALDPVTVPASACTVVIVDPDTGEEETAAQQVESLTAAAGTMFRPPASAYENPNLTRPTALTVTDEGRVFGHVAVWGTCHVGYPGQCVEPPRSPSEYGFFHVGAVRLDDGTRIAVGNLTLGGGHADPKMAWRQAAAHYDRTGFGIATVRAYEDDHGIAVAGWLNPGATPEQIAELERSPLSGDWREIGGELDMIGALAVNSGGFPVPRYATGPAGDRLSLVAAPGVRPAARKRTSEGLEQLRARLRKEVLADVRRDLKRQARLDAVVAAVGLDTRSRLADVLDGIDD